MKPLSQNLVSKTSVQTTTSGKRQFALILPSPSTSPMPRQSTLIHDCTQNEHLSVSPVSQSQRTQYQNG